jgi:acetyltransferase-like isoleucine patch superfamily enzyme
MSELYRFIALSKHPLAKALRRLYWGVKMFTMPAPHIITKPIVVVFLSIRAIYYFFLRVLICEPFFKSYCTSYGRNLRTDVYLHWVRGKGDLIIGDDVLIDGKSSFIFAVRYCERPTLTIGSHTVIGHNGSFTIGKQITIGSHCLIAGNVQIFDSPGHPADPAGRLAGRAADPEKVRPVTVGDNVWIGNNSIILPGVTIGEGSIVAIGSVVKDSVPPNTMVAGNPARPVRSLVQQVARTSDS